jgi:hypothetical protein
MVSKSLGDMKRRVVAGGWLAAAVGLAACGQEPPSSEVSLGQGVRAGHALADERTVTLITGDRVTLSATAQGAPMVTPGAGRQQVAFAIQRNHDEVVVLPEDVVPLIAAGQLDRALFNVSLLLASGYGDRERDDIPLIITGQPDARALAGQFTASDVIVDRTIPALRAVAARQRKASSRTVLAALTAVAPRAATGLAAAPAAKVWLDRRLEPMLDHSVPQIGGTAAHARGFTGAGVVVAVLDSGIDAGHPDLAGKVLDARSFLDDDLGVSDVLGHGTHIASIIAGTGAASDGRYRGVAPDAALISGRVCNAVDCQESAILAGLAWAVVDKHAPIVNLSLGRTDDPEVDPVEDAINQLSTQYGTLFVVAAGNAGGTATVASPGSADAALTVGAVDREDHLAAFSSRGPRVGDGAIKPDLTAPGVDIVAARAAAAGPGFGEPVGTSYLRLSGTSMATPHVAGAAALVLQQHPGWSGAQLKAQLIASAAPVAALTAFEQGAGRVDVDRATRQQVTAEPPSLSLGVAGFPHDDDPLITRTVRYRNDGPAPITLTLDAALRFEDRRAAPAGMIRVAPATITVPGGGSRDVVVTVDTTGDAPDGRYTGALVATGGDVRVETPVAIDREREAFDLTLRVVAGDGTPGFGLVTLSALAAPSMFLGIAGEATLHLPRGRYAIDTLVFESRPVFLGYPRFDLTANSAVDLDSRLALPLAIHVPDTQLTGALTELAYVDPALEHVGGLIFFGGGFRSAQLGPPPAPGEILSWVLIVMTAGDASQPASEVYQLARSERDHIITGWEQTIPIEQFATVEASHAGTDDEIIQKGALALLHDGTSDLLVTSGLGFSYTGAFHRTDHYFGRGFTWRPDIFVQGSSGTSIYSSEILRDYRPGQTYVERWNQAPFGPAFADRLELVNTGPVRIIESVTPAASRSADTLTLAPSMFSGQSAPARCDRSIWDHQRIALFRDGQPVIEHVDVQEDALPPVAVPPGSARYRFEQETTRLADVFELSTRVAAAWTFRSQHVAGAAPRILSLPTLRFSPALDDHNRTDARALLMPIAIDRPPGAATPAIAHVSVEVSFDDGARWLPAPVLRIGDGAVALIIHPAGARHVSLRGAASDVAGNEVEQTIIRAYALAPRR